MIRVLFSAANLATSAWVFGEGFYTSQEAARLKKKIDELDAAYKAIGVDLQQFVDFFKDSSDIMVDLQSNSAELGVLS